MQHSHSSKQFGYTVSVLEYPIREADIKIFWTVYIASFLATLNSRNRLRAIGVPETSGMSNDLVAVSRQDRMDRPGVTSFNSTHKIAISRTVDIELSPVAPTRSFIQSNVVLEHKGTDTLSDGLP
jgi:hypothetical protein